MYFKKTNESRFRRLYVLEERKIGTSQQTMNIDAVLVDVGFGKWLNLHKSRGQTYTALL